jgi:hypothetical protein
MPSDTNPWKEMDSCMLITLRIKKAPVEANLFFALTIDPKNGRLIKKENAMYAATKFGLPSVPGGEE